MEKTALKYLKRCGLSFLLSAVISMICLLLIECISYKLGNLICPMPRDFVARFPTETMAFGADILIYGLIGAVFAGMSFIYDIDRLGILVKSAVYFVGTTVFWLPLTLFIWELWRYPVALVCTIGGFLLSELITTVSGMREVKRNVEMINRALDKREE